jgi:hypothetical protein
MRLLKRHSDEDDASVDTDRGADTEGPAETRSTAETERVVEDRATEPSRPGLAQRFRRTVTVPMTVPRRSVRRTVTVPARRVEPTTVEPAWALAPILATVAGGALAVIGIVAVIRTGLDDSWFRPQVEVLNADHTALLGAIEIGAGALLLLLGLAGSRVLVAMAGIAGALVATAAAVEPEELQRELAIESWWAWTLAAAGVVLTLLALQEPRARSRGTVIDVR